MWASVRVAVQSAWRRSPHCGAVRMAVQSAGRHSPHGSAVGIAAQSAWWHMDSARMTTAARDRAALRRAAPAEAEELRIDCIVLRGGRRGERGERRGTGAAEDERYCTRARSATVTHCWRSARLMVARAILQQALTRPLTCEDV
eukprot:365634-Chlamydomonas_euryale.AAC.16